MKRLMMVVVMCLAGAAAFAAQYEAYDVPTNITSSISMDEFQAQFRALQLLMHVNWIASRITQEGTVLEDEYNQINAEGLVLDYLYDEQARECLVELSKTITDARKKRGDVKMVERVRDEKLRSAFFDSAPDPVAILSSDWKTMAVVAVQAGFSWYMNYQSIKREVKLQYDQEMWRIEKKDMEKINDSNNRLFENQSRLVIEYKLNDRFRVTIDEFKTLYTWLSNPNPQIAYHMLCCAKGNYALSTFYWYHRGVLAYKLGKTKEALKCFRTFQNVHVPFVRRDKMAALVAQAIISIMGEGTASLDIEDIKKQRKIIKDNIRAEDWELHRFLAEIDYGLLKDYQDAEKHISYAAEYLMRSYQDELKDYISRLSEEKKLKFVSFWGEYRKENVPPSSDNLMHCRALLFQILSASKSEHINEYANILWSRYDVSDIERLMYSGYLQKTNDVAALCVAQGLEDGSMVVTNCLEDVSSGRLSNESGKNLVSDVYGIMVDYEFDDHFWVYVPLRWVYTMPTNITFSIYGKDGAEIFRANEEPRKRMVGIREIEPKSPVPVFWFVVDTRGAEEKVDVSQIAGFSVNFEHQLYSSRLYVRKFDFSPSIMDAISYQLELETYNFTHPQRWKDPIGAMKQDFHGYNKLIANYAAALNGGDDPRLSKDAVPVVMNFKESGSTSALKMAHGKCFKARPQRGDAELHGYMLMYENKINGNCTVIDFSNVFKK